MFQAVSTVEQTETLPAWRTSPPSVSVVVPVRDEGDSLQELHGLLSEVLHSNHIKTYELIFVNDGSTDSSSEVLDRLADKDEHTVVVHFRRNFGKAAALDAGFRLASGEVVITMDGDLQDDPAEIPRFLDRLAEGYDLVNGWKQSRQDPVSKTLPSRIFNAVVSAFAGVRMHDVNCGFKACRAKVVQELHLYGELHRFIPVLAHWLGFKVTELPVRHHARRHGRSKYGWERLAKGFVDLLTVILLTRFASRPLHLFGLAGLASTLGGLLILGWLSLGWFLGQGIGARPLFFLGMLLFLFGFQMISIGLIGELVLRSNSAAQPSYSIDRISGHRSVHSATVLPLSPKAQ